MYDIREIAKYIINRCIKMNKPTNNLILQKLLYFINEEYNKYYKKDLFNSYFKITSYGIMYPIIYYTYNIWSALDITDLQQSNINLDDDIKYLINDIIDKYKNYNSIEIVRLYKEYLNEKEMNK